MPCIICLILNIFIIKKIKSSPHKQFYPTKRCKKINQTTRVVISLSIMFVIFIAPTGVLIILYQLWKNEKVYNVDEIKKIISFMIARKYALILYETNMIINLPIYLFTIKAFRETLRNFLQQVRGKFSLARRNSTEIGYKKHSSRRRNSNLQALKVNNGNLNKLTKFRLNEHLQLAKCENQSLPNKINHSSVSVNKNVHMFKSNSVSNLSDKSNYNSVIYKNTRKLLEDKEFFSML